MMDSTINGRTPEEIKLGLECCSPRYESKHWVLCSSECPFRNEGVYCRNVLHACNKKYIQLLEDGIDRVYKQVDALRGLPEKIQQLERERDAAVEQLKQVDVNSYFECNHCKYEELCDSPVWPCNDCDSEECPCHTCTDGSNWQWRGVEVEG